MPATVHSRCPVGAPRPPELEPRPATEPGANGVRAAERALSVLAVFTEDHRLEWKLEDLAERVNLPKSTTHRLLETMMRDRFIEPGFEFGSYRLGLHTAVVGSAALRSSRPHALFNRTLTEAVGELGETVGLSVRDRTSCIVLDKVMASKPLSWDLGAGASGPCHCTAGGKLLLSRLRDEEIRELYGRTPRLVPVTPRSIRTVDALIEEIATVRERGYAIDDEEFRIGVACLAVSVEVEATGEVFALVVSIPCDRRSASELVGFVPAMYRFAARMTAHTGAAPDASVPVR